ncbi:ribonuclease J [Leptolinea tardivitalis]|uniref:Ribonuclease J n=2 Tax=Leptolinea tardivitalis TaxID=229920 RepID=A0A0P6XJ32_9CHLR|nr:ribonuclease J [Leptolinea tardivitalis]
MIGKSLRIIPLGGLGEVGKNMMAYEYDEDIILVDTGIMFPENDMLGVDYIIPDFKYLLDKVDRVKGIFITHGHEDHIGAIHHVMEAINAPIYATPLTRGLLENKLARNGLSQKTVVHTVNAGEKVKVGHFTVEFFHVCHSIPDGVGFGIECPAGLVVHSGDYKFDHTPVDNWPSDYAKLAEFSRRGVLALLSDSTNAERPGWTPSERVIDDAFNKVFREAQGRIIIASFASLISRMQQVANAARAHGRKMAFAGPSMQDNMKIARKLGFLDIDDTLVVPIDQALTMKDREVVIMCTGSQGEPTSILGRLSTGTNRLFDIKPGDTVVLSSHPIPGNEENVYRTINRLFERQANVIYEAIAPVHVSGHASQEEMKLLLHLTQPKFFIPVHGELRQLKQHAKLAREVGIPEENIAVVENGQVIELTADAMQLDEKIPNSYVFVDGSSVGELEADVMRDRESLAQDGVVVVNVILDRMSGRLFREPDINSKGFIGEKDSDALMDQVRKRIAEVVPYSNGSVTQDVERAVRDVLYAETHRKPTVFVSVSKV